MAAPLRPVPARLDVDGGRAEVKQTDRAERLAESIVTGAYLDGAGADDTAQSLLGGGMPPVAREDGPKSVGYIVFAVGTGVVHGLWPRRKNHRLMIG